MQNQGIWSPSGPTDGQQLNSEDNALRQLLLNMKSATNRAAMYDRENASEHMRLQQAAVDIRRQLEAGEHGFLDNRMSWLPASAQAIAARHMGMETPQQAYQRFSERAAAHTENANWSADRAIQALVAVREPSQVSNNMLLEMANFRTIVPDSWSPQQVADGAQTPMNDSHHTRAPFEPVINLEHERFARVESGAHRAGSSGHGMGIPERYDIHSDEVSADQMRLEQVRRERLEVEENMLRRRVLKAQRKQDNNSGGPATSAQPMDGRLDDPRFAAVHDQGYRGGQPMSAVHDQWYRGEQATSAQPMDGRLNDPRRLAVPKMMAVARPPGLPDISEMSRINQRENSYIGPAANQDGGTDEMFWSQVNAVNGDSQWNLDSVFGDTPITVPKVNATAGVPKVNATAGEISVDLLGIQMAPRVEQEQTLVVPALGQVESAPQCERRRQKGHHRH